MKYVLLLLCVLPVVLATSWQHALTASLLGTAGYENHEIVTRSKHPGANMGVLRDPARYGYWAVFSPYTSGTNANDYKQPGFCIDLDHTLDGSIQPSTWVNLADTDDLIGCLQMITVDEPGWTNASCHLIEDRAQILDQTVDSDASAQLAATASWCDVKRIVKYRGALLWIMNNRHLWQGKTVSQFGHAGNAEQCDNNAVLNYGHTQTAIWQIIENRINGAGLPGMTDKTDCTNLLVRLALENNNYFPTCPSGATSLDIVAPLIVKPKTCTDGVSGQCRQYLLIEKNYTIPCDTLDDNPNPASISGYVYADADCNGVKDEGETGIGGVAMKLCQCNNPMACLFTVTESEDEENLGFYSFGDLDPDTCWNAVEEVVPAGYLAPSTQPGSCDAGATISGNTETDGAISAINVVAGASCLNFNFGHCTDSCPNRECETATRTGDNLCNTGSMTAHVSSGSSSNQVKLCFDPTKCPV